MGKACCHKKETDQDISRLLSFLEIIGDKNRLRIICLLRRGDLCVCEIWQELGLAQNLVSHHLKLLREAGLISFRKEKTKVIYSLQPQALSRYCYLLKFFIGT